MEIKQFDNIENIDNVADLKIIIKRLIAQHTYITDLISFLKDENIKVVGMLNRTIDHNIKGLENEINVAYNLIYNSSRFPDNTKKAPRGHTKCYIFNF